MADALIGTAVPILLLMGIGFLSRKFGVLKTGDERVLSSYVYYFALPALFIVDMAETTFVTETLMFIFAGIIPIFLVMAIFILFYIIIRFSKKTFYLVTLSTIFGNTAFFGIPFVTFAFPSAQIEQTATLAAATIGIASIALSIALLEFYRLEKASKFGGLKHISIRLVKNPLIISIFVGILISVVGLEIPSPLTTFLHMVGGTTSAVAVFMLGAFLYGKKYANLKLGFGLSLLRIIFLPLVALATLTLFQLPIIEESVLILMHAMPVAVALSVLSERYDFYRETVASLTLISSVGAIVYLNIWLAVLGV
ncbi:MAG: AEC family transporter [Candidatus Bathyarchaeota archaeon]|nr:AEC family transporter [Candidatus Bathyarchaeum tardum]WGM88704.1 MAG: AEC family transporter [Candidatus Bathyarchaeum tardum]WNZ29040.1 MAG: AEC family transporter [Candidatus Bathyarchaeota archaeon]